MRCLACDCAIHDPIKNPLSPDGYEELCRKCLRIIKNSDNITFKDPQFGEIQEGLTPMKFNYEE